MTLNWIKKLQLNLSGTANSGTRRRGVLNCCWRTALCDSGFLALLIVHPAD